MSTDLKQTQSIAIKTPSNLSPRIQWLRDYFFRGVDRAWNNEYTSWTTGTPWDFQYNELSFYIVPETYAFLQTFRAAFNQVAHPVALHPEFWAWSLPERRAWFNKEVMLRYLPKEVLPGDLLAGARFNIQTSACLTQQETREHDRLIYGSKGSRAAMLWFHNHGYGNAGATSGHLIPDYGARRARRLESDPCRVEDGPRRAVRRRSPQQEGRAVARHVDGGDFAARTGGRVRPTVRTPGDQ